MKEAHTSQVDLRKCSKEWSQGFLCEEVCCSGMCSREGARVNQVDSCESFHHSQRCSHKWASVSWSYFS